MHPTLDVDPGPLSRALDEHRAAAEQAARGLWQRNTATWSADPAVQKKIANRLGWLDSPGLMAASLDRLLQFANGVKRDGITDVVLLGMGGSSLAPEVLRAIVGVKPGWPRFHMLDSTDPAAVLAVQVKPETTIFIVASKSGTTIEPNSLAAYFRQQLEGAKVASWARHFVAITDEGTALAARARADGYRDLFINPSDIGGRYSALSFFGMVPAALMGQDVRAIVDSGLRMLDDANPARAADRTNPSEALGLLLGACAANGRDKMTLVVPPALEPFGLWVEQLIAESTGKHGKGIIPIAGEARTSAYGDDRVFVRIGTTAAPAPSVPPDAGAPVASIELASVEEIGGEFARWEIATAIAGAVLGINPFDEPNVQQAKDATNVLLGGFAKSGALPVPPANMTLDGGASLTLSRAAASALGGADATRFLKVIAPRDYVGLLAYLGPDPQLAAAMQAFRTSIVGRTTAATMFGYGPRYLHSTGQLHKGGPNTGVFVLVSAAPRADVPVPQQPFSFGTLELAQALGDFSSLDATGRRALHVHLPSPDAGALKRVFDALLKALP